MNINTIPSTNNNNFNANLSNPGSQRSLSK